MSIDFSPLPEALISIRIRYGLFALYFIIWTVFLLLLSMLGSLLNSEFLVDTSVQVWMYSIIVIICLSPIALAIYLFRKSQKFTVSANMYLSSFSNANNWNFTIINGEHLADNPYMPPDSKKGKLSSYPAATLWTIDGSLAETQISIVGLRYFKVTIGPGNIAPHYMTVVRVPRNIPLNEQNGPGVHIDNDDLYWYIFSNSLAVYQREMKALLSTIRT